MLPLSLLIISGQENAKFLENFEQPALDEGDVIDWMHVSEAPAPGGENTELIVEIGRWGLEQLGKDEAAVRVHRRARDVARTKA